MEPCIRLDSQQVKKLYEMEILGKVLNISKYIGKDSIEIMVDDEEEADEILELLNKTPIQDEKVDDLDMIAMLKEFKLTDKERY